MLRVWCLRAEEMVFLHLQERVQCRDDVYMSPHVNDSTSACTVNYLELNVKGRFVQYRV